MNLPDRIEKRLKKLGLKRAEASRLAQLNATYVRDLIHGRVLNPRTDHIARLALVLQTTPEWLAEERGPEERDEARVFYEEAAATLDKIDPADRPHALKALKGFVKEDDGGEADDEEAPTAKRPRKRKGAKP